MKANPGGIIAPDEVVGRQALIQSLWRGLENQSVLLVSERRIGKSSIVSKMKAECPDGVLAFYDDLEGVSRPIDFVERVFATVDGHLSRRQKTAHRARAFLKQTHGGEFGGFKFPAAAEPDWPQLLEKTLQDLVEHQRESRYIVFFWDELPVMVHKIRQSVGEQAAMAVLDVLRAIRQTNSRIRMVYTGSIGLHHVVHALRNAGHASDVTNDMLTVEVDPLAKPDALSLATQLLQGEHIETGDENAVSVAISEAVDRVPYYIHYVIRDLCQPGGQVTPDQVHAVVDQRLADPQDSWHLSHYRVRLNEYYDADLIAPLLTILDELALAQAPLTVAELRQRLRSQLTPGDGDAARRILEGDDELLRHALHMLARDHYLHRTVEGAFTFRFPLIARWWRIDRGLGS